MATSLKAQEVLDSLIGVLQVQADQLPPIHARLGLRHEALEEDLDQLRQQLEITITKLVERRRVEVNEWERRCHALERDCSALGKCLGSGMGVDEGFLSTVHSEPVLPTRHAMILEVQQKLQKLYTARLDQRNLLSRVLIAQERIVGPDFHSSKHTQPLPNTTEYDKDGQVVRRAITHEKLAEMEAQVERGEVEIGTRLKQLYIVLADLLQLHVDLGLDLPSETDLLADTSFVITTEDETQVFPCASTSTSTSGKGTRPKYQPGTQDYYDSIFAQYVAAVTLTGDPNPEVVELKDIEPTKDVFDYFRNRIAEIEPERTRREARVQVMFDELEMIWARLSMPENYPDEFSMSHTGVSDATLQAYEQELVDMQEKRRSHLPRYIQMAREQIIGLWDGLMAGPNQRTNFRQLYEDEFTEDLLTAHEQYVQKLRTELNTKANLMEAVHKYMRVMEDEATLVAMSKDPARLSGKGGILLKEEKLRKRLNRDKPKLEAELRPAILAWEQENSTHFVINDARFLDTMGSRLEPESKPRPKPTAPPRGMTPVAAAGQKHIMASASGSTAKRAKLGGSMASSHRGITPTPAKLGPTSAPTGRSRGMGLTTPSVSAPHTTGTGRRHPLQTSAVLNNHARTSAQQLPSFKLATPATTASSSALPQPSRLPIAGPKTGFSGGIGLGPPPKSPQRQTSSISHVSDGSVSSSSTIRLVSSGSSSSMSGSTLRTFSAGSFRTASGMDVASLVLAKGRRGSFKPRPSLSSDFALPLPLQNMAEQSRNWTVVREESDEDDDSDVSS